MVVRYAELESGLKAFEKKGLRDRLFDSGTCVVRSQASGWGWGPGAGDVRRKGGMAAGRPRWQWLQNPRALRLRSTGGIAGSTRGDDDGGPLARLGRPLCSALLSPSQACALGVLRARLSGRVGCAVMGRKPPAALPVAPDAGRWPEGRSSCPCLQFSARRLWPRGFRRPLGHGRFLWLPLWPVSSFC